MRVSSCGEAGDGARERSARVECVCRGASCDALHRVACTPARQSFEVVVVVARRRALTASTHPRTPTMLARNLLRTARRAPVSSHAHSSSAHRPRAARRATPGPNRRAATRRPHTLPARARTVTDTHSGILRWTRAFQRGPQAVCAGGEVEAGRQHSPGDERVQPGRARGPTQAWTAVSRVLGSMRWSSQRPAGCGGRAAVSPSSGCPRSR